MILCESEKLKYNDAVRAFGNALIHLIGENGPCFYVIYNHHVIF